MKDYYITHRYRNTSSSTHSLPVSRKLDISFQIEYRTLKEKIEIYKY